MTSVALRTREDTAENAETGRLFEEYSGQLLAYCSRQLGSRSEGEDAVQTTFLYALRALRRGVVPECEAAWLTTIARNVCHWQRRTRDRRGPLASDLDLDTIGLVQAEGDVDGVLVGLKGALASIPEKQRHALVLREWQGVPAREIASQLGLSRPATHALLTRARRSLAEALTTARRPVLGLACLVVELRSHVKALLGGVSTKAVATAVAVAVAGVGLGVGGIAVEKSPDRPKAPPASVQVMDRSAVEPRGNASAVRATPTPTLKSNVARANDRATRAEVARPTAGPGSPVPTVAFPDAGEPAANPELVGEVLPQVPDLPVDLPVALLPLPTVELPTHLAPSADVPPLLPVDLPSAPPTQLPVDAVPLSTPPLP